MKKLLVTALMLFAAPGMAAPDSAVDSLPVRAEFARVVNHPGGKPHALQLAIVRYTAAQTHPDLIVDLISAVHIGDKSYYGALNERFRDYDALLYEMVISAPGRTDLPRDGDRGLLSNLQIGLKDALGLAFQLDEIDYSAGNFVHADLSADMLFASMDERGESLYVYFWRLFYAAIEDYARDPLGIGDMQMMSQMLFAPDDSALKILIAHEMVKATHSGDFLGSEDGSAVIASRNAHAIEVLKSQIAAGANSIGIFYGAAHMPDFDQRLVHELGMRRAGVEWADAWRLDDASPATR